MKRDELLQRLKVIRDQGSRALHLLDTKPLTAKILSEVQSVTRSIKEQLEIEYQRTSPERAQKAMSIFELSVYAPTIEEAWKAISDRRVRLPCACKTTQIECGHRWDSRRDYAHRPEGNKQ